jgi:hypothetical protein
VPLPLIAQLFANATVGKCCGLLAWCHWSGLVPLPLIAQLFVNATVGKCCGLLAWCPWAGLVPRRLGGRVSETRKSSGTTTLSATSCLKWAPLGTGVWGQDRTAKGALALWTDTLDEKVTGVWGQEFGDRSFGTEVSGQEFL